MHASGGLGSFPDGRLNLIYATVNGNSFVRLTVSNLAKIAATLWLGQYGSGLGDRTCMALAIAENLPALTADKAWANVQVAGLKVQLVR